MDLAIIAACLLGLAGFWAGWQGHAQSGPDYSQLGSAEGCAPSDHWPCWKVDQGGCLWYANSTAIVRYCQGNDGGWVPCDPAVNATVQPCDKQGGQA